MRFSTRRESSLATARTGKPTSVAASATAGSAAGPGGSSSGSSASATSAIASIAAGARRASIASDRADVVVAHVPELVGDDEADLVALEVAQERVEQHDALRPPEPVHVGVARRRPAARVDLEDLADLDARRAGRDRGRPSAWSPRAAA